MFMREYEFPVGKRMKCERCGRPFKQNARNQKFCGRALVKGSCGFIVNLASKHS